jgi:small subunit ribosomal protein S17
MALKERVGTVVSDKMEKTVVVAVENRFPHPIYQKTVSRTTRYKVHDEDNACRVGDRVRIIETRPLSRTKRWKVAEVLDRATGSSASSN